MTKTIQELYESNPNGLVYIQGQPMTIQDFYNLYPDYHLLEVIVMDDNWNAIYLEM